jgi:hypothetical protein
MAADPPKEGTYSGTFSGWGTFKGTQIGKEKLLTVFDQNALVLTSGLLDHTTWHCYGLGDFTNGMGAEHGCCAATDLTGDQAAGDLAIEKHAVDAKSFSGSVTWTAGTGKYAGITGIHKFVCDDAFRGAGEGTFFNHCTINQSISSFTFKRHIAATAFGRRSKSSWGSFAAGASRTPPCF